MTPIGKSLVFYFRFWYEMQRLYEGAEGTSLEGLQEPEKTRRMAQAVGTKAYAQAADLLDACAIILEKRFKEIGQCERIPVSGKALDKNWSLSFGIWPKDRNRPYGGRWKMQAGVDILKSELPAVIPWIWRHGGEHSEETLAAMLANKAKGRSQELELKAGIGSVGLDRVPLLPDKFDGFELDRDPLIARRARIRWFQSGESEPALSNMIELISGEPHFNIENIPVEIG